MRQAVAFADGHGAVAVNVKKAVGEYPAHLRQACESGAHAIVVGAGLPFDLPDIAGYHPDTAPVPILSDARGVQVVVNKGLFFRGADALPLGTAIRPVQNCSTTCSADASRRSEPDYSHPARRKRLYR